MGNMTREEQKLIGNWDTDKNGTLCASELISLVKEEQNKAKRNTKLRFVVLAMAFVILLLIGAMFGMSLWAAELSKETHTSDNGVMTSTSGKPVVVGQAKAEYALLDLPQASEKVLLSLDRLQLKSIDGSFFIFSVQGVARKQGSLTLFGSGGMRLKLSGESATLFLSDDGKSHVVKTHKNGRRLADEEAPKATMWYQGNVAADNHAQSIPASDSMGAGDDFEGEGVGANIDFQFPSAKLEAGSEGENEADSDADYR